MSPAMQRLASGNRVNTAADDAAGMAIIETMTAQLNGMDQGTRNTLDMQALATTAEGGLNTVSDSLQRIRELSVQAANDTNTPNNRQMMQSEINQLADQIQTAVTNTQFNNRNLLDGGGENLNLAPGPGDNGTTISINDMSSLATAVANFNVTGQFSINDIDSALSEVSGQRAQIGAQINRMDHIVSANSLSSLNLADARSRIRDADMAREMAAFTQDRVINEMEMLMQQQEQNRVRNEGQSVVGTAAR
jgi:flagellin